jgi:hypothetical protein
MKYGVGAEGGGGGREVKLIFQLLSKTEREGIEKNKKEKI